MSTVTATIARLVFMTSADTIKGKSILRDGRVAICFDDERPPFSFVTITGTTTTSTDPDELLAWATGSPLGTWATTRPRLTDVATRCPRRWWLGDADERRRQGRCRRLTPNHVLSDKSWVTTGGRGHYA